MRCESMFLKRTSKKPPGDSGGKAPDGSFLPFLSVKKGVARRPDLCGGMSAHKNRHPTKRISPCAATSFLRAEKGCKKRSAKGNHPLEPQFAGRLSLRKAGRGVVTRTKGSYSKARGPEL